MSGPVENDIDFATRQITDDTSLLEIGLANPGLKQQADVLWKKLDAFRRSSKGPREYAKMSDELRTFLNSIIARQGAGEWVGWLTPLFVEHLRREVDLFAGYVKVAAGQADATAVPTPLAEFKAWTRAAHDHAATLEQYLDPSEGSRIMTVRNLVGQFGEIYKAQSVTPQFVQAAERAVEALDAFVVGLNPGKAPPEGAKSVIHPLLVDHVLREGRRFLNVLHGLKTGPGAPALV